MDLLEMEALVVMPGEGAEPADDAAMAEPPLWKRSIEELHAPRELVKSPFDIVELAVSDPDALRLTQDEQDSSVPETVAGDRHLWPSVIDIGGYTKESNREGQRVISTDDVQIEHPTSLRMKSPAYPTALHADLKLRLVDEGPF